MKSTSRGDFALAGAAGGSGSLPPQPAAAAASAGQQGRRAPHPPACASSHSAIVVNPIMIASIQYWDRTASLD